jgi:phenylalanyl-tRNA synthetase beta chain
MNIKILDSWLREHVKTSATPQKIGELLSLTSVGVERIEKFKNNDYVYDIEVTTNRPDLMSVIGLAREAGTVLPQNGIKATFTEPKFELPKVTIKREPELTIKNDPKLIRRICAVIMEVTIKDAPQIIKDRLEASGIRSLNNVIDITNYVMRETGHPTHVFDYDRLTTHTLVVRESKKGEKVRTLDDKEYTLSGGDLVADNGKGEIIDMLGLMGTANSVVTKDTKRILFFIEAVEPTRIRKASMEYGIRTEAAVLNEKGLNPEYIEDALAAGIKMFEKIAGGKVVSNIIDIYPTRPTETKITITEEKINRVVGVQIPLHQSIAILTKLGFGVKQNGTSLEVSVPAKKSGDDMQIPEDIIEEIARVYGYHNIPGQLPPAIQRDYVHVDQNQFYWEDRIKDTLKYWGFTEVYTYPMVSKALLTGTESDAVTIHNPLTEEFVHMRKTLIPGMMEVVKNNQDHETIKLFEIANVFERTNKNLPKQILRLGGLIHRSKVSFYEVKGVVEQLLDDLGITDVVFKHLPDDRYGASVFIGKQNAGVIEIIDDKTIDFELEMDAILEHVKQKRTYKPISKFPQIVEDMAVIAPANVLTGDLIDAIAKQNALITEVSLLDKYQETRTFHIVYQSHQKNLTDKEVGEIREKIIKMLKDKFSAVLK